MQLILQILTETIHLLVESSVYVIFGLVVSGLIRMFLSPASVAQHLGKGRFRSVFKAAILGIPMPLCSCGVLPAAVSLKKQGANNGATTAFLISTPESGVDSISITYALLDPIMTVARPVAAFLSAMAAGVTENLFPNKNASETAAPDLSCPVDGCCEGMDCSPEEHRNHHTFTEKIRYGMRYAFTDVWNDMAVWFMAGLLLAGAITVFIPEEAISRYLGGGIHSMLIMLGVGIPIYICATASTPIAAALILKGVSPGAALVFLLAGPATNVTSLTVLFGFLGKRATVIYLTAIAVTTVVFGLVLDQCYGYFGLSAKAVTGQAAEIIPLWIRWAGAAILLVLSAKPVFNSLKSRFNSLLNRQKPFNEASPSGSVPPSAGCTSSNCDCASDKIIGLP